MTRRRMTVLVLLAVLMLGTAAASAQTRIWQWQPFRLLSSWAIAGTSPDGRFTLTLIGDAEAPEVCVAVIMDSATSRFSATSVPTSACDARRGR